MKNSIIILFSALLLNACMPASTPSSGTQVSTISPEAEAKSVTNKMKASLVLDDTQEEKVFLINVVNLKILKRLRETNDTAMINSTRVKYQSEIKEVLTETQYDKFLVEFKNL